MAALRTSHSFFCLGHVVVTVRHKSPLPHEELGMSGIPPAAAALVALIAVALARGDELRAATPATNGPLAFQRFASWREDDRTSQIFTRSPSGTEQQITHFSGGAFDPVWSPDGSRIAFNRWFSRTRQPDQLLTIRPDGRDARRMTTGCRRSTCLGDEWPSWSPDGRSIAFVRIHKPLILHRFNRYEKVELPKAVDIMVVDAAGGTPRLVRHFGGDLQGGESAVTWSPDGRRLVFAASSLKHPNKHTRLATALFSMSASGGGSPRRITPWALGAGHPHWSPDGAQIAFNSQGGHSPSIYAVRPDGTALTLIVPGNHRGGVGPAINPSWSPDGQQIVFAASAQLGGFARTDIYSVKRDGSDLHPLVRTTRMEVNPSWAPLGPG